MALLHYVDQDRADEQADLFNIVRAALHSDENQAADFLRQLHGSDIEQDDLPDEFFS